MSFLDRLDRVAVIGGGTMGNGIAQVFAQAGYPVVLIDPIEETVSAIVREKLGGKAFIMRSDEITFATHIV